MNETSLPSTPRAAVEPRRRGVVPCAEFLVERARRGSLLAACALSSLLVGCEPSRAVDAITLPAAAGPFDVTSVAVDSSSTSTTTSTIVVELTADVDADSVGPRSIRVERAGGRRRVRAQIACAGSTIFIAPDAAAADLRDRAGAAGDAWIVTIEGGASPRAVRSASGEPLAARHTTVVPRAADHADFDPPRLVSSHPADGDTDVAPGTSVELCFSEPLAGPVSPADAVALRADGRDVAVRARMSPDRRRILVRPLDPLAPGVAVELDVKRWIADRAGNAIEQDSARTLRFRTRSSSLHEIREEFVCDDMADPSATDSVWGDPRWPGLLVARWGAACDLPRGQGPLTDLGDRESVRFQMLARAEDRHGTLASSLRLLFAPGPGDAAAPVAVAPSVWPFGWDGPLRAATVEAGPFSLDALDPSFDGNRRFADLVRVAGDDRDAPRSALHEWETDASGNVVVDVPFDLPVRLESGVDLLIDVRLSLAPGARLLGVRDPRTLRPTVLVDGGAHRETVRPLAGLVVTGESPAARSRWYDAGCAAPLWQRAFVSTASGDAPARVEFQAAPAAPDLTSRARRPDEDSASDWSQDLASLPRWRFVRFRVRFDDRAVQGPTDSIESVVMPYVMPHALARGSAK